MAAGVQLEAEQTEIVVAAAGPTGLISHPPAPVFQIVEEKQRDIKVSQN